MKLILLIIEIAILLASCSVSEAGPIAMARRADRHARIAARHQAMADALATSSAVMASQQAAAASIAYGQTVSVDVPVTRTVRVYRYYWQPVVVTPQPAETANPGRQVSE